MRKKFPASSWVWKYKPRTVMAVEEYVFNRLMNPHGYKGIMTTNLTYEDYCSIILSTKLPIVLSGNFSKISRVKGHIVCGIGYSNFGLEEVVVHDPYGSALKGYPKGQSQEDNDGDGFGVSYATRYFERNKKGHMYAIVIKEM